MKLHLLLLALIALSCSQDNVWRQTTMVNLEKAVRETFCGSCLVCSQNIQRMASISGFNLSTNPISKNPLNITTVQYQTRSFNRNYSIYFRDYPLNTSYLFTRPKDKWNGKVILYYHPTIFGKMYGPTSFGLEAQAITGLYSALGYMVVFPDYIGYGESSWNAVHPYVLYPGPNIQNGKACLQDVFNLIRDSYPYGAPPPAPYKVHTVGYSEGASYALFHLFCEKRNSSTNDNNVCLGYTKIATNRYTFTNSSGLDGAYSLNNVVLPFLKNRVSTSTDNNLYHILKTITTSFGKPPLASFALLSYAYYSKGNSGVYNYMLRSFYDMNCTSNAQEKCNVDTYPYHTTIGQGFAERNISNRDFPQAIGYSALGKIQKYTNINYVTYAQLLEGRDYNSIEAFIDQDLLNSDQFKLQCKDASLTEVDFSDMANSTFIFTLNKDSVVSPLNSITLLGKYSNMQRYNFTNSDHQVCDVYSPVDVDHIRGQLIANIMARNYFQGYTNGTTPP